MCPPLPLSSSFHSGKCKVEEGKGGRRRRRRGNFPWEFWEKRKKMKEGEGASLQLNPPSKSRWKKKEEEKEEEDIGVWGERRKQAPRICHISRCRGFDREKERERDSSFRSTVLSLPLTRCTYCIRRTLVLSNQKKQLCYTD